MKMNTFEFMLMKLNMSRSIYLRSIVKDLFILSKKYQGKKVLEIGCGNGIGSKYISEFFKPEEFIATDIDDRLVEVAKKNINDCEIDFEVGDATNLRFADNEFNLVIGLSVVHHIPNWKDCIDELERIIKPRGLIILKELSIETFETPFGKLSKKIVSHPYDPMFREVEFINHLKLKGFEIYKHKPHSLLFFINDFYLVAKKIKV